VVLFYIKVADYIASTVLQRLVNFCEVYGVSPQT
jgi:hypothetical protein